MKLGRRFKTPSQRRKHEKWLRSTGDKQTRLTFDYHERTIRPVFPDDPRKTKSKPGNR